MSTTQLITHSEFAVKAPTTAEFCPVCEAVGEGCTTAACHGLDAD